MGNHQYEFYRSSLYFAMPVLSANVRAFTLRGITETQLVFCSSYVRMYFLRLAETPHRTNRTVFISLVGTCTFCQHFLPSVPDGWERTARKRSWGLLSFPPAEVLGSHREGTKTSQKGYDRVPWLFPLLRMQLPSFCTGSTFYLNKPLGGCHFPSLHLFNVRVTGLPRAPSEPGWATTHGSELPHSGILCSRMSGVLHAISQWGAKNSGHTWCMPLPCSHACGLVPSTYKKQVQR